MKRISIMGVAAGILILCGCSRQEPTPTAPTPQQAGVRLAAVRAAVEPFSTSISVTGTLVSPASVTVKAETTGRVVRFPKEEGDSVAANEPLIWVDDSHEKLSVRLAESAVQGAQAGLERARVLQAHAESEWTRAQNLLQSGGITDRDYKVAELAERDAKAQIGVFSAQLDQARSQVATARKMLEDSVVRAPVAGELQKKLTAEGAYVEAPTPVFSIVNNARLELESMVASTHLGRIRAGQQVRFSVNTFPGEQFTGRVIEVNPAVETDTRSAKVRVQVDNRNRRLKAGMFAQGEILTDARRQGILLPLSAVQREDRSLASAQVYVIENGRAKLRQVQVGVEHDSMIEITSGISAGDIVAIEQSIELADGVPVSAEVRSK